MSYHKGLRIVKTVPDKYNENKFWVIYIEKCRHYSLAQRIKFTNMWNEKLSRESGFSKRCGLAWIKQVLGDNVMERGCM